MVGQPGFFDLSNRYAALIAAGDPLERLASVVDFEVFRGPLIVALRRSDRGKGGRPPFDPVMMFKILVLQALYSLSDEATGSRSRTGPRSCGSSGWGSMARCGRHHDMAVPGEAGAGQGDRQALRALRCGADRSRVPGDGRPDHQCDRCAGAQAAQNRRGEGGYQAGQDPGALEGKACQSGDRTAMRAGRSNTPKPR